MSEPAQPSYQSVPSSPAGAPTAAASAAAPHAAGRLEDLLPCFQGIVPSIIATCSADGEPNVTYISQVYYVDPKRLALSCQFFNKTRRNIAGNPYATVISFHPVTFEAWRLRLRFDHSEYDGPLFDTMAMRIQVIASHTGMAGVFKLLSADVYDVLAIEPVERFLLPPDPVLDAQPQPLPAGPLTELRGVHVVSERIARARDLEGLLAGALAALDELLGFSHSMILVPQEESGRLVAIAMRGYGPHGIGAEVAIGEGILGTVAEHRRMIRVAGMESALRYGRAIRGRVEERGEECDRLSPEIPLPGLPDAQALLALPLLAGDRLVGVLSVESRDPLCFDEWDEAFLQILGNQIAMGIDRMQAADEEAPCDGAEPAGSSAAGAQPGETQPGETQPGETQQRRTFAYDARDDSVFVDGEYLVRNVPGKILWKLLNVSRQEGRNEFTNRELRLDPSLGLPPIKDNLESRLILLRKRLAQKCPEVRLVPVRRGRFVLEMDCAITLADSAPGSPPA
ncbi:MAG: GAF domain-containing protein [Candidatus Eisenbacteria bacterium]